MKNITLIKACLNDNCDAKHAQLKCSITDKFCMKCGQPLYHVCKKCGAIVDNDLQVVCDTCVENARLEKERKREERKRSIDQGKHTLDVVAPAAPVALQLATKLVKNKNVAKTLKTITNVVVK